jgi:hypothetical protein
MVSHAEFADGFSRAGLPPGIPVRTLQRRAKGRVRRPQIRQLWEILR